MKKGPASPLPPRAPFLVPLRGVTGKVWGMLDPETMIVHFKHGPIQDRIDLSQYRKPDPLT